MSLDFVILENAVFYGLYIILDMHKRIPFKIKGNQGRGAGQDVNPKP
jgi:hypothetical protein